MSELNEFVVKIKTICSEDKALDIKKARQVIEELNNFLYCSEENIGTTYILDKNWDYFSKFHKYWEENHKEILNLQINDSACKEVAEILHEVFVRTRGKSFNTVWDTFGLNKDEVCRVRFLTANQDFRGSRKFEDLAKVYKDDPSVFDIESINTNPDDFISSIGITDLSQNDKRKLYAKKVSQFLIDKKISPIEILNYYDNDLKSFKSDIMAYDGSGYGNKKTDMFIRDMVVLGIWKDAKNFEEIDVASDINTIKIALRTGILTSEIPLLSSFLDIFDYQYSHVESMSAKAWRRVWEIWKETFPKETISSPCLLDYFIYNVVGKQICKESLCEFRCEKGHIFKWHSPRNKTCQVCYKQGIKGIKATIVKKMLPCTDEQGHLAVSQTDFVSSNIANPNYTNCPFKAICDKNNRKNLMPPKSISIIGKTGWESAYSKKGSGGGGLMA